MALKKVGVDLLADHASEFQSAMKKSSDSVTQFAKNAGQAGSGVSSASQVMIGALRQVGALAVDAMLKAARAVADFAAESVNVAGNFEAGMNKFRVAAGSLDTKGLDKFRNLFIQLGRELPVSTMEVEAAATEMVTGGIDPAIVAAGALRTNIQFAAAANISLTAAAEIAAKTLAAWTSSSATASEKAAFLGAAMDTLVKAAAVSSTTVEQLKLGLFNVGGAAQALGVSFQDTTTTLALLAPYFQSSAQAGTSLKTFLERLVPTTKPAIEAMMQLGIVTKSGENAFFDAQGHFLGMANAAQVLHDKLGPLSEQEKIRYEKLIFSQDAANAANVLMKDGAIALDTMTAAMVNANGVQGAAAIMQQGYNTSLENFHGSIEALQITLGSKFLPILTTLLNDYLAPAVNTFTTLTDAVTGNQEAFNSLTPTFQAVANSLKGTFEFFDAGKLDNMYSGLTQLFGAETASLIVDFAADLKSLAPVFEEIATAVGPVVAAVASELPGAFRSGYDAIKSVVSTISSVVQQIAPYVQEALAKATQFWNEHGTEITAFVETNYNKIASIVQTALSIVQTVVSSVLNTVAGFVANHGDEITAYLSAAWDLVKTIVSGALDLIQGLLSATMAAINGDWSGAWEILKSTSATFVQAIITVLNGFVDLAIAAFNLTIAAINDVWTTFTGSAPGLGSALIDGIISGVKSGVGALTGAVTSAANSALDAAKNALGIHSPSKEGADIGAQIPAGFAVGISRATPLVTQSVKKLSDEAIDNIKHLSKDWQESVIRNSDDVEAKIQLLNRDSAGAIDTFFKNQEAAQIESSKKRAKYSQKEIAAMRQLSREIGLNLVDGFAVATEGLNDRIIAAVDAANKTLRVHIKANMNQIMKTIGDINGMAADFAHGQQVAGLQGTATIARQKIGNTESLADLRGSTTGRDELVAEISGLARAQTELFNARQKNIGAIEEEYSKEKRLIKPQTEIQKKSAEDVAKIQQQLRDTMTQNNTSFAKIYANFEEQKQKLAKQTADVIKKRDADIADARTKSAERATDAQAKLAEAEQKRTKAAADANAELQKAMTAADQKRDDAVVKAYADFKTADDKRREEMASAEQALQDVIVEATTKRDDALSVANSKYADNEEQRQFLIAAANAEMNDAIEAATKTRDDALTATSKKYEGIEQTRLDAIAQAEKSYQETATELNQQRTNKAMDDDARLEETRKDLAADAVKDTQSLQDTITALNQRAADDIASIQEKLNDAKSDRDSDLLAAQQTTQDRIAELNAAQADRIAQRDADLLDVKQRFADDQIAMQQEINDVNAQYAKDETERVYNLNDAMKKLNDIQRASAIGTDLAAKAQAQLAQAEQEAAAIGKNDAELGSKYYALRADQILELANLQKDLAVAQQDVAAQGNTPDENRALYAQIDQLQERIALTKEAQSADLSLFNEQVRQRQEELAKMQGDLAAANKTGGEIVAGIVKGITDNIGALSTAMSDAVQQAIAAAKLALGIASPSRIAAMQIGMPITQGIVQGMLSGVDAVASAANILSRTAAPPASASQLAAQSAANITNNNQRNYNLSVTTQQSSGTVMQDFAVMRAMAL